jgi:cation diffusion facilitator family transporter
VTGCGCDDLPNRPNDGDQARTLWWLLAINGVMFFAELLAGIWGDSTALIADSIDMLADATVYAIALFAVGRAAAVKHRVAHLSGIIEITLGASVLIEVIRRLISGSDPEPSYMIAVGIVALIANSACLMLIHKHRNGDIHMRASWIFSKNDVIANIGVITAGTLVLLTNSPWPDLIIGLIIAIVVVRGGWQIITETQHTVPPE